MKASPSARWLALVLVGCAAERGGHDEPTSAASATATMAATEEPAPSASAPLHASAPPAASDETASVPALEAPDWPSADQRAVGLPAPVTGDRIYSKSRHLWIRSQPGGKGEDWMGYLSLGDSIRVRDGDAKRAHVARGEGSWCREWYAVEPRGFVCTGMEGTLDANDPEIVELVRTRANTRSPWPYRYGESLGAAVASRLPEARGGAASSTRPALFPMNPAGRSLFHDIAAGSTVAYTDAFEHDGKPYLLTWDRGIVEQSRVKPYPESPFHGLPLGGELALPLAFVRADEGAEVLRREPDGTLVATGTTLPRLAWATLTGRTEGEGRARAHETRDGRWLRGGELAIARQAPVVPPMVATSGGRKTWVDISLFAGTLVAYEDEKPVYATLVSPGRGGPPVPGKTTLSTASTPIGTYAVLGKFTTATMISSTVSTLVHTEVQYTQNFEGPYSLHGAYWHDRWGLKKSAGCVNLAPIDAHRLFAWTDPPLPEGWHGMKSTSDTRARTLVNIRR
ncbi:MAG: L,D-transpeptidase [Deltaproteobacteria bacterium]|nr:L,D-transpeptidase [Deltaproteobacteria bacterium]